MSDHDAIAAHAISEGIDRLVDELAYDEAVITSAMVLALARRLAHQTKTHGSGQAGLELVCSQLRQIRNVYLYGLTDAQGRDRLGG